MPRRSLVIPVAIVALLVAGCSSPHAPKTDPPPTRSTASTTASTTAATTTSAGPAATPTPGTVPVDQIPPGRPASWIPAGVTTIAPWKEPGDVLPKFTLAMFSKSTAGAWDMANYYVNARNWAFATLDPTPFLLVCKADACQRSAEMLRSYAAKRQHMVGCRQLAQTTQLYNATAASAADQIARIHLQIDGGAIVSDSGVTVQSQSPSTEVNDVYLKWSGRLWVVVNDALAPRGTQ